MSMRKQKGIHAQFRVKLFPLKFLSTYFALNTEQKRACVCNQVDSTNQYMFSQAKTDKVNERTVARVTQLAIAWSELAPLVVAAPPVVFDSAEEPVAIPLEPGVLDPDLDVPTDDVPTDDVPAEVEVVAPPTTGVEVVAPEGVGDTVVLAVD